MKKTNRSLLKIAARESMGTAQPSAKMVTLVYILLTTLMVSVIENATAAPFNQLAELLASADCICQHSAGPVLQRHVLWIHRVYPSPFPQGRGGLQQPD